MVNLSLTKPMQVWVSDSDGTGLRARQSQEQADGVTPAGFFLCPWSSQLASPALAPINRHISDSAQIKRAPVALPRVVEGLSRRGA
jgi:hypothetical protein